MKIIRNIAVALSMYSKIPMPIWRWKDDDMKYALGFIGLVGVIIGAIEYGIYLLGTYFAIPVFVKTLLWTAIPLLVTGGFHVDGFMDVQDALHSYQPKEEKLRILKDPHIGAFAVISLGLYGCLYIAATYMLLETGRKRFVLLAAIGFVLARGIGAFLGTVLKHAKQDGLLHEETKKTGTATKVLLILTILFAVAGMFYLNLLATALICVTQLLFVLWYRHKCYKEFGGISGDTVGYFITESELLVLIVTAIFAWWKL